jgi:hypothetical protein
MRHSSAGFFFLASALLAQADSKTLVLDDVRAVEIMVDFKIEDLRIDGEGNVSLVAKSSENGEAIGFSALISKPRRGERAQMGKDQTLPVVEADITIKSIGAPTTTLQASLDRRLRRNSKDVGRRQLVGLYCATSSFLNAHIAQVAFFQTDDVGITPDEKDSTKTAECFSMRLVIDGPLERLTAYFSLEAGYGADAPEWVARQQWYKAHVRPEENPAREKSGK